MIRILADGVVYHGNGLGGIARYWTETIRAFNAMGESACMELVVPPKSSRPRGLSFNVEGTWRAIRSMLAADIFHSSYYRIWPSMRMIPLVTTVYDWITGDVPLYYSNYNWSAFAAMQKRVVSRSSGVIAISEDVKRRTVELTGFPEDRIEVAHLATGGVFAEDIPPDSDKETFRQLHTGGAPFFVHVGRKNGYKNFRVVLDGYLRIADRTDRHLLAVGGEDTLPDDLAYSVFRAHAEKKVHILPHAPDGTLRLAYAASDGFLSASLGEGFGLPILEALASGAKPILSDIPVYREVAGDMAEYLPPSDPDAWADAMLRDHLWNPEWRERVLGMYSWKKTAEAHLRLYRKLLDQ